jgi:hypothetical protein
LIRFDVTTSSRTEFFDGKPHTYTTAQAIVYSSAVKVYGKWKLLSVGEERDNALEAYVSLWETLQEEMGTVISK